MWFLIVVVCTIHIFSIDKGHRWLFYTTKITPILLMSAVVISDSSAFDYYTGAVFTALLLSAIGDWYLMQPKDKFIQGLLAFLFAHIAYSTAFIYQVDQVTNYWIFCLLLALGTIVFLLLLPGLGDSAIPVGVYSFVILIMVWGAIEFWLLAPIPHSAYAMLGAITFVISDIVLAIDRFRSSSAFSRHVVMVTYYTAQGLLTLSAVT